MIKLYTIYSEFPQVQLSGLIEADEIDSDVLQTDSIYYVLVVTGEPI